MKKYPLYSDFPVDDIMYGVCAPYVGCGIYHLHKDFQWPDRECTTKKEYDRWVEHLKTNGYEIPKEYMNAHIYEWQPEDEPDSKHNPDGN